MALRNDGQLRSSLLLRPGLRGSCSKWIMGSPKLRVGSWNIGLLMGKSIELMKILEFRKIN